jgi:hypothetical protein
MYIEGLINHTAISIVGWLLGISLSWGTSYALLALWHKINLNQQKVYPFAFFIPWRTIVLGFLMVNYVPIFPILWFSIGNKAGIFSVAYIVFWLTLIFVFQSTQKPQKILQFWSWSHTMAVFSVLLTAHYGTWGGGGLGYVARQQLVIMKYDSAWTYFIWMVGVALMIDLVMALGQLLIVRYNVQREAG